MDKCEFPEAGRSLMISALREELCGPAPSGKPINCEQNLAFDAWETYNGPWHQEGSGEEILIGRSPTNRYGVGVLFPMEVRVDEDAPGESSGVEEGSAENGESLTAEGEQSLQSAQKKIEMASADADDDDYELSSANRYKQSALGVSFLASLAGIATLEVTISGGIYRTKPATLNGKPRTWWLRSSVSIPVVIPASELCGNELIRWKRSIVLPNGDRTILLELSAISRPQSEDVNSRLLTFALVNKSKSDRSLSASCLFQTHFVISASPEGDRAFVLPYPNLTGVQMDEEEQSIELLYRDSPVFAVGHGCAADWKVDGSKGRASCVSAVVLPTFETPSITPDIHDVVSNKAITVAMSDLAGLTADKSEIFNKLSEVAQCYSAWIENLGGKMQTLSPTQKVVAERHIAECRRCHNSITNGIVFLKTNSMAFSAFQLSNHAILIQRINSSESVRTVVLNEDRRLEFPKRQWNPITSELAPNELRSSGTWRAFQIAFFLMSLASTANEVHEERKTVELIWFPTGGGKTEAYLALSAFSIFLRRLRGHRETGVDVLMRYTLRLLTAQQFLRASRLICAMEYLRGKNESLGETPFSIGIWLGMDTTPNSCDEARGILRRLKTPRSDEENAFLIDRCPWCSVQMGPVELIKPRTKKRITEVLGYTESAGRVHFHCPDMACHFRNAIPCYVVDEDIYNFRPSLVIGTVDKFAMLAWRPEARSLFGISMAGTRDVPPPNLIIQDELHLISGPLGSMTGFYETLIEELATLRLDGKVVLPKIVCSTATIRRYREQILNLYARKSVRLFPPPGIDASDSFFAAYDRREDGTRSPGRMYVGINAPALGSMQTSQVRTFSSLLQGSLSLPESCRDPWWSLVVFFNSLRELGTTLSLLQSGIPDYLKTFTRRCAIGLRDIRKLYRILELTGRLRSDEVPKALASLETPLFGNQRAVDVALTSSIMEVGVDIDRLSLMAVVGQPKTTSQYIQVTGRVGRRWQERPGLIATIYSASKPRDRSHFEHFRSYHERLYGQVEPTSVTPFSPPVLDRALHAVMVGYVRQAGDETQASSPYPYPIDAIDAIGRILKARIEIICADDADVLAEFNRVFARRKREWEKWGRSQWQVRNADNDDGLIRFPAQFVERKLRRITWPTPTSMRSVDAECQADITTQYLADLGEEVDA